MQEEHPVHHFPRHIVTSLLLNEGRDVRTSERQNGKITIKIWN